MKKVLIFILYGILFFAVIFGILYAGENWILHYGKTIRSMLIDAGVAAAIFTIVLAMVGQRSEQRELENEDKQRDRARARKEKEQQR